MKNPLIDSRRRAISLAGLSAPAGLSTSGPSLPACAQDIQERTIRFGHLNNADHPVSFGVERFGELVAAESGGKMKVQEVSRAAAQKAVGELQAKGMQYNEVASAEQVRMRQIARPVVDKFIASYDPTIAKRERQPRAASIHL